jgi:hypothetical protein
MDDFPSNPILDQKEQGVKFNKDMVIVCEAMDRQ